MAPTSTFVTMQYPPQMSGTKRIEKETRGVLRDVDATINVRAHAKSKPSVYLDPDDQEREVPKSTIGYEEVHDLNVPHAESRPARPQKRNSKAQKINVSEQSSPDSGPHSGPSTELTEYSVNDSNMTQTTRKWQILFDKLRCAMNWLKYDDAPITASAHRLGRGRNAEEGADDESLSASGATLTEALAAEARYAVLRVLEDGVDEKEAVESILKISVQIMQRSGSKLAWLDVGTITDAALDLAFDAFEEREVIGMAVHVMESCGLEVGQNRKLRPEVYALVHSMELLQGPHGRLQAQKMYSVQSHKSVGGKECEAAELICQAGVFLLTLAAAPHKALSAPLNLRHLLLSETRLQSLCLRSVTASLCPPTTPNPTLLFVPVARVTLLKEQEPHLAHVKRALSGGADRGPVVVSLVGRAGSGKTQVALALALSEPYAAVLWIDASAYALEASVRRACNALGLKGRPGEPAAVLSRKLREHLESCPTWLVVLDKVEAGSAVSGLMPLAGSCHVLITTQAQECGVGIQLSCGHMSVGDAAKCLGEGTAVGVEEVELLPSLAGEVDCLPLALCALKWMLRSGQLPSSLLCRLRTRSKPPTNRLPVIEEHPRSSFSTPSSLREALDGWVELVGVDVKAPGAPLASAMVEVCGFFGPTPVPPPLLALAANAVIRGKSPPDEVVAAACRSLVALGLASEQRETGHLLFYPLLQDYSRHRSQAAEASLAALTALSASVCTGETYPHCLTMWAWRSSLDKRKECATLLPVLGMRLTEYFFQGVCPRQAVPFCGQVLQRYTPTTKCSTKLYVSAKCLLADLLVSELSDKEGAVSELKDIPRQMKDPLGLLATALLLAFSAARARAGKDLEEEVREVEGKIEAMGESLLGKDCGGVYKPEALYLVTALNRLATLLKDWGQEAWLEMAAEIEDKTLDLCDWALPPGTPLTLHSCRSAGGVYFHRFLLSYWRVSMPTQLPLLEKEEAMPRRMDTRGQGSSMGSMGQGEWVKDLFATFPPFPKPSPATLPLLSPAEEAEEQRHACRVFKFLILNTQRSRALWGEQTADPLLEAADLACWALLCPLSAASVALMETAGGRLAGYLKKMGVDEDRDGLTLTKKEKFTVQSCLALIRLQSSKWREEGGAKV